MAFEIPWDLIKQVQISLREEAKISSYDHDDYSLPNLPSLHDSISELDPSPPYLRCKHCKGRLLRGIQSLVCVFCGKQQRTTDNPPDPIKFTSTFGYKWLLGSLNLDGSEMVGPAIEANELNRGQNAQLEEFPLSDLLDLEIQLSAEEENSTTSVSNEKSVESKSSLNLVGVDLDNFFAEGRGGAVSTSPEVQLAERKPSEGIGNNAFQGYGDLSLFEDNDGTGSSAFQHHENLNLFENNDNQGRSSFQSRKNLNLFENVQPSETTARSAEDKSGDSFSGWDTKFQSTGTGIPPQEPKSADPFVGSDLSSHLDTIFGSGKNLSDGRAKDGHTASLSNTNDWFQDDIWSNSNPRVTHQTQRTDATVELKDVGTIENSTNSSSMNVDWIQDNPWKTSAKETPDRKTTNEDDDSFDAWNGFRSSTDAQDPSIVSLEQTGTTFQFEKKFDGNLNVKNGGLTENVKNTSSMSVDWIQDDQSQISSSRAPDNKTNDQEDDSFDVWNDFTCSTNAQVPSSSSLEQTANNMTPSVEQTSEINLFSATSKPQDIDFGSFMQTDFFSGDFSNQNGSLEVKDVQSEASASHRMGHAAARDGGNAEEVAKSDISSATEESKTGDVDMLMSQMHDLSFMLECNLSVPPK